MNRLRAALSLLLVITALIAGGAPATAGTLPLVTKTYVDKAGVVHYVYDPAKRPGASFRSEGGTRTSDGCLFDNKEVGVVGSTTITLVEEVTYDPATCTHMLSIATYDRNQIPTVVATDLQPPAGSSQLSSSESAGTQAAAYASWWQRLSAWISDPVGIRVSETKTTRSWDSNGWWSNNYYWGWYAPSGWVRTSYSTIGNYNVGDTIGSFKNEPFCDPFTTYTEHYQTRLTTYPTGYWEATYSMNKSGPCNGLLSYNYAVG